MSEKKPAYLKVLARTLRSYAGSASLSLDLSHALDEAAEELDRRAEPASPPEQDVEKEVESIVVTALAQQHQFSEGAHDGEEPDSGEVTRAILSALRARPSEDVERIVDKVATILIEQETSARFYGHKYVHPDDRTEAERIARVIVAALAARSQGESQE